MDAVDVDLIWPAEIPRVPADLIISHQDPLDWASPSFQRRSTIVQLSAL